MAGPGSGTQGPEMAPADDNNNNNNNKDQVTMQTCMTGAGAKYQLRPRSGAPRRLSEADWNVGEPLRHKARPAPLSRYRRKTANARERYRMRQINTAFESLRGVLPSWVRSRRAAADMTKICTLRLASAYIRSLQDLLDGRACDPACDSAGPDHQGPRDADLVALLCGPDAPDHDLHAFPYLTAMTETEAMALLLGGPDPPAPAHPQHNGHYNLAVRS